MTEFLTRIFGGDVHQTILNYFNEMKAKGTKFAQEMKFSGKLINPSQTVFGFAKSVVNVDLKVKFEVANGNQVYVTDATATLPRETPWFKRYFFSCQEGKLYKFPSFPSIAEIKTKWCQSKIASKEEHPEGKVWCQSDTQTLDDYFMYGDPYPKSLQECAVVRSLEVYAFHFKPDSDDGINVEADIRYDLRYDFPLFGYKHLNHGGTINTGHGINKYFLGGLMLGGAFDDFKKFLAKTKASMDCAPALEGLLQVMMAPRLATP